MSYPIAVVAQCMRGGARKECFSVAIRMRMWRQSKVGRKVAANTFKTKIEHWAPPKNYTSSSEASNRAMMIYCMSSAIPHCLCLVGLYDLKPLPAIPPYSVQLTSKHFSKQGLKHNTKIQLPKK
jgi:hypothetical protein